MLYCSVLCFSILYFTVLYYTKTILYYIMLDNYTILYHTIPYYTILYYTIILQCDVISTIELPRAHAAFQCLWPQQWARAGQPFGLPFWHRLEEFGVEGLGCRV